MSAIDQTLEQIVSFARTRGARRLILFGSRARGDAFPKSDIDLAVEGCADFLGLEEDVSERLWSLLKVDLVNLDAEVSDALLHDIRRDSVVLYEEV